MVRPSSLSLGRHSWWWVFGLFIATPAVALAILGLRALRADEVEHRQRLLDQQAQIARLADAAVVTALDQMAAAARTPDAATAGVDVDPFVSVPFDVDSRGVLRFPADRVIVASPEDIGAAPPDERDIARSILALAEQARTADARGQVAAAAALYERVRSSVALRPWADLQLLLLRAAALDRDVVARAVRLAHDHADARSASGLPLPLVVASLIDVVPAQNRRGFVPLLGETIRQLHAGRWWLTLEQRRAYGHELRRWLTGVDGTQTAPADERLEGIALVGSQVRELRDARQHTPTRAEVGGTGSNRHLVVWTQPQATTGTWAGVAVPAGLAAAHFDQVLTPILKDLPYRVALRDRASWIWGGSIDDVGISRSLDGVAGWTLAFGQPASDADHARRLLDYARVLFPVVVLACGLLMTAWIVRRELALHQLQSSFLAAVTHEFKSPLASIRVLMERLRSGKVQPGEAAGRYYAAIESESDRLDGLVSRLLESQMLQSGLRHYVLQPADLGALVREVSDRLRPQAEARQINLEVLIADRIPTLAIDTDAVAEAVRNLIDNALKYSAVGTRVVASVDRQGDSVHVTVADEGVGVAPEDTERIFEPFFRSRRGDRANVHGTGLGLSLVKATALAHSGTASVDSDGQRGSRFTLSLPIRQSPATRPEADRCPAY